MSDEPIGQRFSQVYLDRGKPGPDSARMRARFGSFVNSTLTNHGALAQLVLNELGTNVPAAQYGGFEWRTYFQLAELRDVLDTVTLAWTASIGRTPAEATAWLVFVERVFREENTPYRVDPQGGVHLFVDAEFEASRAASVVGLGLPRYGAARAMLETGFAALDGEQPNTTIAVRGVFDALETVFRLAFENRPKLLGHAEVLRYLQPTIAALPGENDRNAAKLLLRSFAEWVNSAHHYRHAPGVEDPAPPPRDLTLVLVGTGTAFLRWLVAIDMAQHERAAA